MTEKRFTMSEIYTLTNEIYIAYSELFKNQQISFHEYTIIENTIMRIQQSFEDRSKGGMVEND